MGIFSLILGPLTKLLGQVLPDPKAAEQAKLKLLELEQQGALADLDSQTKQVLAQAGIIQAEAASHNWLTAAWRPITMLTFVALIVARMFGLTAANVSPAEYLALWGLVKLGLGGYVLGRSAEKIAPSVITAIKGAKP